MATTQRTGIVRKWLSNIGQILDDQTSEPYFCHWQGIRPNGQRYRALVPGQHVRFTVVKTVKGPVATDVHPV
jgi:cold shock CspA family protein